MKKRSGYKLFDSCMIAVGFIIAAAIAAAAGVILWGATLLIFNGIPWLGKARPLDLLIFFIPLMAIVVPMFYRQLSNGRQLSALWCVALAPILGLASAFFLTWLSMKLFSVTHRQDYKVALLSLAIYAPIAFFMYRGIEKKPASNSSSSTIQFIIIFAISLILWLETFRILGAGRWLSIYGLMSFIIPLLAVILPVSFYLLRENKKPTALLCAALAPALCLCSTIVFTHLAYTTSLFPGYWNPANEAAALSLVVYAPITISIHHWAGKRSRKQQQEEDNTVDSKPKQMDESDKEEQDKQG